MAGLARSINRKEIFRDRIVYGFDTKAEVTFVTHDDKNLDRFILMIRYGVAAEYVGIPTRRNDPGPSHSFTLFDRRAVTMPGVIEYWEAARDDVLRSRNFLASGDKKTVDEVVFATKLVIDLGDPHLTIIKAGRADIADEIPDRRFRL